MISKKTVVSLFAMLALASMGVVLAGCPDKASGNATAGSSSATTPAMTMTGATAGSASAKTGGGSGW